MAQRFIGDGQVIEDRFLFDIHPLDAILNNDGDLVGEGRIVGQQVRDRQREHVAVTVLVLQTFARERGASGRAADEKPAAAHVGRCPDQIADSLEAEHRVINEEGNRVDSVIRIGGTRRDERAHRSRLR